MLSDSKADDRAARSPPRVVGQLLDPLFGFLVWAVHLLLVYCANALACARGIGASGSSVADVFKALLVGVTLAGLLIVGLHALRRWRDRDEQQAFMTDLTIGNDAIAAVGIAVQLLPIFMLHLCR